MPKQPKKLQQKPQPNVDNGAMGHIKKFFNSPRPLIVILLIICVGLLIYIVDYTSKNRIFIGYVDDENAQIVNVHYFTNGDMNYFYATNASYMHDDVSVYMYKIGYYVKDANDNYLELAVRQGVLDKATSLKELVTDMSGWSFAEQDKATKFFTREIIKNMGDLHFIIQAATTKDATSFDINYNSSVSMAKITK